jgi:hypothetical protein
MFVMIKLKHSISNDGFKKSDENSDIGRGSKLGTR